MYSLIITVKSIESLYSCAQSLLLNQYLIDVETSLPHGDKYVIPSLLWPPPLIIVNPDRSRHKSFMSSCIGVNS